METCVVDKRGIAQKALLTNAHSLILIHNHPTGDSTLSENDRKVNNELRQLGELIGIPFIDMFVLGDGVYTSFKEEENL